MYFIYKTIFFDNKYKDKEIYIQNMKNFENLLSGDNKNRIYCILCYTLLGYKSFSLPHLIIINSNFSAFFLLSCF